MVRLKQNMVSPAAHRWAKVGAKYHKKQIIQFHEMKFLGAESCYETSVRCVW